MEALGLGEALQASERCSACHPSLSHRVCQLGVRGPRVADVEACQGHQRCWSTGAPGPLSYWHTVQSHHAYTVWVARSELLSSQKERQWSHSVCPTRAGDIFGNLSLSHPFSCKISPGSRTPFCTYPKASFRQRMQTQGLGPLPLWGRSMTSTLGLWYMPSPHSALSPVILGIEY